MGRRKKIEKKESFVKKAPKNSNKKVKKDKNSLKVFQRVMGMKDILAADYVFLNPIVNKINDIAASYDFKKVETPLVESYSYYKKVLNKDRLASLFLIDQKSQEKLCLRPDLVHGVTRALIEHSVLNTQEKPSKFFSMGPVFRQEKLRSGVYRQFNQFNFSIFNDNKPSSDAFLIYIIYTIFKELQIDVQIQVNSLGDALCQKEFLSKFSKSFREKDKRARLCPECKKLLSKDPEKVLECQEESCVQLKNELPQISNYLSEESNTRFYRTLELLDELDVNYNFNPYLIKDLGYYNDLIFEVWPLDKDGEVNSKTSLGRGGRYDKLFPLLMDRDLPILSFNGSMERLLVKSKENDHLIKDIDKHNIFLAQIDDLAKIKAMFLFKELLNKGFNVSQAFHLNDLRGQMEEAKNYKSSIVLILGKKEVADETILFRDTESGVQEIIAQKDLIATIEKKIK